MSPWSTALVIMCQVMPWRPSPLSMAHTGVLRPAYSGSGPSWKLIAARVGIAITSGDNTERLVIEKR